MESEILKQTTLSNYQYKIRKQTVKLGKKTTNKLCAQPVIWFKDWKVNYIKTQHHNMAYATGSNEMNNHKKLNHINKI